MAKRTVTIKKIYVNNEGKDGKPYKSPLVKIYFDTDNGEQSASSFVYKDSVAIGWKVGDKLELDFVKNGEYLNFVLPKATDLLLERIIKLENAVFGSMLKPAVAISPKPVKSVAPKNNPNATVEELEQEKNKIAQQNEEMADSLPW